MKVKRCKDDESHGGHGYKDVLRPPLLEQFDSIEHKVQFVVQHACCLCQISEVTREPPGSRDRCERLGESCGGKWPATHYRYHGRCSAEVPAPANQIDP